MLKLQAAATGRVPAVRLALVACLACWLHLSIVRADEPAGEEDLLPASAFHLADEASWEHEEPLVDLLVSDEEVDEAETADDDRPRSLVSSAATPAVVPASEDRWSGLPQGMVPYIGSRTPDSEKDRGIGGPLARPWRSNPFSISGFSGFTAGDALIKGHVLQRPAFYAGFNVGWDYDHYWGIEKRLGFGDLSLTNAHHDPIGGANVSITGEYRLMYYPLGDARWRPFLTSGLGWSDFYFHDDHGRDHLDTVGMVPFGAGLKYLHNDRFAFRIDMIDELTFAAGALSTFHYAALTAGLEVRYGHRLIKMPWHKDEADSH